MSETSSHKQPYLLSAPALILFLALLGAPLLMTLLLSFNGFDFNRGILPEYSWANYWEVLSDEYFHEIFLRTFGIAFAVTLICMLHRKPTFCRVCETLINHCSWWLFSGRY